MTRVLGIPVRKRKWKITVIYYLRKIYTLIMKTMKCLSRLDLLVIKEDATQGIDFSAGHISVAICNRALPTMGCDFTVIIVAFLVKLHMLNH